MTARLQLLHDEVQPSRLEYDNERSAFVTGGFFLAQLSE